MVIYEVNIKVKEDIFNEYVAWLVPHIEEMVNFPGFLGHVRSIDTEGGDSEYGFLTVHYFVESKGCLDDYLENHSSRMRGDGEKKFGGAFSATRRVLNVNNHDFLFKDNP